MKKRVAVVCGMMKELVVVVLLCEEVCRSGMNCGWKMINGL
jgi:hypothetical protein